MSEPLDGDAIVSYLMEFEQIAFGKMRAGSWDDWEHAVDAATLAEYRKDYGTRVQELARSMGKDVVFKSTPSYNYVHSSPSFRRPFRVEWTRRLYSSSMGQTDPESQTFATVKEAVVFWKEKAFDGYDAHICERDPKTGEWEY